MPTPLSGPGVGLPLPQNLYPSELSNAPIDSPSNRVALAPGQNLPLPAGDWYITLGQYLVLQYLDPVTGVWTMGQAAAWTGSIDFVKSDGFNVRIANLTGCPVSAVVTNYGAGSYVQASTTISVTGGGGSTWLPIVGGQLGTVSTFSINIPTIGGGYGVAPILLIPPPPPGPNNANGVGGIQAHGWVSIANGTVNGVTLTNPGAGYPTAPTCVLVTNPTDPNIATGITQAAVAFSLTGSGSITGVLCTNNGAPITPGNLTLTVSGTGTQATVVPLVLQTATAVSVTGGGLGFGTVAALITSAGGQASAGTITNSPEALGLAFRPRPVQAQVAPSGATGTIAATVATIIDGGLFLTAPTPVIAFGSGPGAAGSSIVVGPTITFTMGSKADFAVIQPAP